jgi:hypothetical protein
MTTARIIGARKVGFRAFWETLPLSAKIIIPGIVCLFGLFAALLIQERIAEYRENYHLEHMTSALHLAEAKTLCRISEVGNSKCLAVPLANALYHLDKIPPSAPEHTEAAALAIVIQQQQAIIDRAVAAAQSAATVREKAPEPERLFEDPRKAKLMRNVLGQAHDPYECSISTNSKDIMSFDSGQSWWLDDGRCAQERSTREQRERDNAAKLHSYWSTTIRVDTDMDPSWLPNEERTCQTQPDDKGKVAGVACNPSGSHREHNIPVTFWGGVERNTISDWKCRREKSFLTDEFVCRAID